MAAVIQILVPDVPVVGWWALDPDAHPPALRALADISDQVVADLSRSGEPLAGLQNLAGLTPSAGAALLREFEWSRSAHWRVLTAELFEQSESQARIPLLTHLEVDHADAPVQALLYGAWFASRLGLEPGPRGWWVEGGSLCVGLTAAGASRGPLGGGRRGANDWVPRFPRQPCRASAPHERGRARAEGSDRGLVSASGPMRRPARARRGGAAGRSMGPALALTCAVGRTVVVCSATVGAEEDDVVVKSLHQASTGGPRTPVAHHRHPLRRWRAARDPSPCRRGSILEDGFEPDVLWMRGAAGQQVGADA